MSSMRISLSDESRLEFSNYLKLFRTNRDITQKELASKCDVSVNTISSIENGKFLPSLTLLVKLCYVFDLTPSHLLRPFIVQIYGGEFI